MKRISGTNFQKKDSILLNLLPLEPYRYEAFNGSYELKKNDHVALAKRSEFDHKGARS